MPSSRENSRTFVNSMATSQAVMDGIRLAMPTFRNNHDKIVFAVHTSFIASGFDLIATGRPAFAADALSSTSQDMVGFDGWNEFDKDYAFVYMNNKRTKKLLVKCLAMDDYLLVDALADGGDDDPHLMIDVWNYTTESSSIREQFKNLDKLVTDLKNEVLYKLDKGLKPVASRCQTDEEPRHPLRPQIHPLRRPYDRRPGPSAGMLPERSFGDRSMLLDPDDRHYFRQFGDQRGFIGPPQPQTLRSAGGYFMHPDIENYLNGYDT